MKIRKLVFGQNVTVNVMNDNACKVKETLCELMNLYPEAESVKDDIIVNIINRHDRKVLSRNSSAHVETEDGFLIDYGKYSIHYSLNSEGQYACDIQLKDEKQFFIAYLKKLNNIQYSYLYERIAQILFENVLVPSVYFINKLAPIHSAAVLNGKSKTVLLGGTGGVGKTSLELELCRKYGFSFLSDDISIIDDKGYNYPNLSFPKIYGYNIEGDKELKRLVFKSSAWHDKLVWKLKYALLGPSNVRRAISPELLFDKYSCKKSAIDTYLVLLKENINDIAITNISPKQAANATLYIMKTEYFNFNNHLYLHKFNRQLLGLDTIVDIDSIFARWLNIYLLVFKSIDAKQIKLPINISHQEFLNKTGLILKSYT